MWEDGMGELNEIRIRDFTRADRDGALDALGAAFAAYPPSLMMFGGGESGAQRLRSTNELLFRPDSKVRAIVAERDGVIVGVLTYVDSPDCNAGGARQMLTFMRAVGPRIVTVMRTFNKVEKVHPKTAHRHLPSLGVHPAAQGHGVGGRLMTEYASRCDDDGIGGYLETITYRDPATASSRSLYERHGFVLADEVPMTDDWSMITMHRAPATPVS
jgi:GNAT superfamily N-acetyltransferase